MFEAKVNKNVYTISPDKDGNKGSINGQPYQWDLDGTAMKAHVISGHKSYRLEIVAHHPADKTIEVLVNGHPYTVSVKDQYDRLLEQLGMDKLTEVKQSNVKAPMPGLVLDILVSAGQHVTKDEPIIILEAMKMENMLKSPCDGVIKNIAVQKGKAVEKNTLLIEFE